MTTEIQTETLDLATIQECDEELEALRLKVLKHGWSPHSIKFMDNWLDERLLTMEAGTDGDSEG